LKLADFYDAELRRHDGHFRAALDVGPRDRVLDIGCGAGQSTRDAARAATAGSAVGVDVSDEMLEIARSRSAEEGLRNVAFERGDAQVHAFPAAHFDLCISRFGTMFFADPVAAFVNIGAAMRPGARLVLLVWQGRERNEWSTALQGVSAPGKAQTGGGSPAFSLGDRAVATGILTEAGFGSIAFTEVHEPVFYGPTVAAAYEAMAELYKLADATDRTRQAMRTVLEAHLTAEGVLFDSRAWIVTARRSS
jgi:SAM-dependent methyltransferase